MFFSVKKIIFIIFMVLLIAFPYLVRNEYYIYLACVTGIYIMLVLGLNLLFGYTGQISLGHAGFFGLGAYGAGLLEVHLKIGAIWASGISLIGTMLIAYFIGYLILRMSGHYLAVATLAFGMIISVVVLNWHAVTNGVNGIFIPSTKLFGRELILRDYYFIIFLFVLLCYYICYQLVKSRVGRAMKAIRDDEIAAQIVGINIVKYKVLAFVLSAAFASFAGSIYTHLNKNIAPYYFDIYTSIIILVMNIVGGLGSNVGAVIGTVFIKLLPEFLHRYENFHLIIYGVLLLVVLIFSPNGIVGVWGKIASRYGDRLNAKKT